VLTRRATGGNSRGKGDTGGRSTDGTDGKRRCLQETKNTRYGQGIRVEMVILGATGADLVLMVPKESKGVSRRLLVHWRQRR